MNRIGKLSGLAVFAALGLLSGLARADRRSYVWTYEYMTMPQGEFEIEYYLTGKVPDTGDFDAENSWEHQAELEYGLTDHWDVAIYQRWLQTFTDTEDTSEYAGTKLRTRYRLREKGSLPLDTLLYLEYLHPDTSQEPDVLEGKLVLSRDFGKFNVAYNQILALGLNHDGETEHEYALGFGYEFSPTWKAAFESTGNFTEDKYFVGPTVSWAGRRAWLTAGLLTGLNDRSDDLRFRLILGIPL